MKFYVSTSGNDSWSGCAPDANKSKTDGPFRTLERARDAVRDLKKSDGLPAGGIVIEVRGGTYELEREFELTSKDSGTKRSPVVYRATQGEEVRISGGRHIESFSPVTDPKILSRLGKKAREEVVQADLGALGIAELGDLDAPGLELFFEDKPMALSRWPKKGFRKIADLVGGDPVDVRGTKGDRTGKFMYEGNRPNRWKDEKEIWVHGYWFWDWSDQRHKVESIDTRNRIISVAKPYHSYGYRVGQWFYALNILAELSRPGEWYLDRETGILYFWPPKHRGLGAPRQDKNAVAERQHHNAPVSMLQRLVTLKKVRNGSFERLTFECARGTAMTIAGSSNTNVNGCTFRNLGHNAVEISGGADCGVSSCDITQTGRGGIKLNGGNREKLTPAGHFAENNHIHHYSRWNRMYHPAISIEGVGNRASHNLIHDAPHMALYFGGNDHVIEYNEIHHVCEESNDAGAIYSGRDWTMRGTVIRYNYLHHICGFEGRGCVGVYLDDMFCGTLIYGNVFFDVTRAAFIGGGRDCSIENNIFVDCNPAIHIDARAAGWANYHVDTTMTDRLKNMPYRRRPWSKRYPELLTILKDQPEMPKDNVVTHNICSGGKWDEITGDARQFACLTKNLIDDNPGFRNAGKNDFRLKEDSLAFDFGFVKIPVEEIGLTTQRRGK